MDCKTHINFEGIINEPVAPNNGELKVYAKNIAGRMLPKWMGPDGFDTPFQSGLFFNRVSLLQAGGGTTIDVIGCTITNVGTVSHPTPVVTNIRTIQNRFTITSAVTAAAMASTRPIVLECVRGNAADIGGFFMLSRFGLTTLQAGMRGFFGLVSTIAAPSNIDPTTDTTLAKIGIGINANTGNLKLINNAAGTVPTVLDLGASFTVDVTNMYEIILFCKPNDTKVEYRITNMNSKVETKGSITTNLPLNTSFLARTAWLTNNATLAAVAFDCSRFGLETDY